MSEKLSKYPNFFIIFARKMPEFYIIIARNKYFFPNFSPPLNAYEAGPEHTSLRANIVYST